MWWNEGLQCAVETGFNYSNQCENILEQQQKTAQDLCTITIVGKWIRKELQLLMLFEVNICQFKMCGVFWILIMLG